MSRLRRFDGSVDLLGGFAVFVFGLFADAGPVFFTNIFIDGSWLRAVEAVLAVFLWAGNPVVIAGVNVKVVRFKAIAFQALECFPLVVKALSGFRECNAANACRSDELVGLVLDVHDARSRHGEILVWISAKGKGVSHLRRLGIFFALLPGPYGRG